MHIHRSSHTRDFTVLPNSALCDRRLSFAARGLLAYLLSLPDGSPETIRSLAEDNPDGRQGIAGAFAELTRHGYFRVVRHKDRTTGRITTTTSVSDVPQVAPRPAVPGPGRRGPEDPGGHPSGKNPGKEPSLPRPVPAPPACPASPAAGMLFRLVEAEPRLRLGTGEAAALAPLADQWLARGASERDLRAALLPGLPRRIHSPAALLRTRLLSKMPPVPLPKAAAPERHECAHCRDPIPRAGICRSCAGIAPAPSPDVTGLVAATRRGAARARVAMWGRHPVPAPA